MDKRLIFNQFLYDFRRTITSKTVIIITAIIILLGSAFISFINPITVFGPTQYMHIAIYEKDSNYEVMAFFHNLFGDPLPDMQLKVNLVNGTPPFNSNATIIASYNSTSNSSGFAIVKIPKNINFGYLTFSYSTSSESNQNAFAGIVFTFMRKNDIDNLLSQYGVLNINPISSIESSTNSSRYDMLVFFVGKNGTKPIGYKVYVMPTGSDKEIELGTLDNYYKIFKMDGIPNLSGVTIVDPNGKEVIKDLVVTEKEVVPNLDYEQITVNFISGIMVLLIPLMVLLAGYNLYGKDKINGILDFIHSLPITRTILGISRYLSILLMTILAASLSLGLANLLFYLKVSKLFPAYIWYASLIGLTVTACALLGLIMIFSLLLRSTGSLLAISIIIWLVFGIFWNAILIGISLALGIGFPSREYIYIWVYSQFVNPMGFFSLLISYFLNSIPMSGFGLPVNPAAYGITLQNLIITGLIWSLIPFLVFLYLLRKRE